MDEIPELRHEPDSRKSAAQSKLFTLAATADLK
jgi:hypothetical protein